MLIENTQPAHRGVGEIYLIPGVNRVDPEKWNKTMERGYKRSVDSLIADGILKIVDEKITIAIVNNTYDADLLEDWLPTAKGPLKGAIKKQIAMMTEDQKAS